MTMSLLSDVSRPNTIKEMVGQQHLIGENKTISNLLKKRKMFSSCFYGPSGVGKTTLAHIIVNTLKYNYKFLNAAINNKEDFIYAINEAKMSDNYILIIDEIHRMNKDKQDILLPYLEKKTFVLIGITNENPYHKINSAIRSRCLLYEFYPIKENDIVNHLNNSLKHLNDIKIDNNSLKYIAKISNGDLRYAINLLEVAYYSNNHNVSIGILKEIANKPNYLSTDVIDEHYNLLSALQKSIRGSDPDAAIHYLARLIEFNDLDNIYRRLIVIGYEDIGLANPSIQMRIMDAVRSSEYVGLPEARLILSKIVIEMCLSPKSNSTYLAILNAHNDVLKGITSNIPNNILYNSKTYENPHNFENNYININYLPDELQNVKYYIKQNNPVEQKLNDIHNNMKGGK